MFDSFVDSDIRGAGKELADGISHERPVRHLADDSFEEANNQVSPRFIGVGLDEVEATAT
jgi:hypothetical protein